MYNLGRSDENMCKWCNKEEGAEKHRLYDCPTCKEVMEDITGSEGQHIKETMEVAKRAVSYPQKKEDGREVT